MQPTSPDLFHRLQQVALAANTQINKGQPDCELGIDAEDKVATEDNCSLEPSTYTNMFLLGYWDTRTVKSFDDAAARIEPLLSDCAEAASHHARTPVALRTSRKMTAREVQQETGKLFNSDWGRLQQVKQETEAFLKHLSEYDKLGPFARLSGKTSEHGLADKALYSKKIELLEQEVAQCQDKHSEEYKTLQEYQQYLEALHMEERVRLRLEQSIEAHIQKAEDPDAMRAAIEAFTREHDISKLASNTRADGVDRNPVTREVTNRFLNNRLRNAPNPSLRRDPLARSLILDTQILKERGFRSAEHDDPQLNAFIAELIFHAMNNQDHPLYASESERGADAVVKDTQRLLYYDDRETERYDAVDLFLEMHTDHGLFRTGSHQPLEKIRDTYLEFGVIPLKGLNPTNHPTLMLGCGHISDHSSHDNMDTLDIRARGKPDALLRWGTPLTTRYLENLKPKYREIIDEGPVCAFMNFSDEFFDSARACLKPGGRLLLPKHVLKENKIPTDFVPDIETGSHERDMRYTCQSFIYRPELKQFKP